jgi:hypothetical protein
VFSDLTPLLFTALIAACTTPEVAPLPTISAAFCIGGIPLLAIALPTAVLTPAIVAPNPIWLPIVFKP